MRDLIILVIDDEQLIRWSFEKQLGSRGYKVYTAESGEEGIKMFEKYDPDIVFVDNKLPGIHGIDVIPILKAMHEEPNIVFMTAYGSIETAVKAMKQGAIDYISKPFNFQEIHVILDDIKSRIKLNNEVQLLRRQHKDKITFDHIIAESATIRKIIGLAKKIALTNSTTVLLLGESGTGKDMFAKAIHNESERSDKPFVTINCSSLPDTLLESELFGHEQGAFTDAKKQKKGLFEIADGGTVFLDEIGDMNHTTQVKLLSVIENRVFRRLGGSKDIQVDIRIIAATNKDLQQAMVEKVFREDLYYRLKVFQINLPPLREHAEDIPFLAEYFINQYNKQFKKAITTIEPKAREFLMSYQWPGNIRELRNVMERAVILQSGDVLMADSLPQEITGHVAPAIQPEGVRGNHDQFLSFNDRNKSLYDVEKQVIINALEKVKHNQTQAAKLLGITRDTLRYKIKKYGL